MECHSGDLCEFAAGFSALADAVASDTVGRTTALAHVDLAASNYRFVADTATAEAVVR